MKAMVFLVTSDLVRRHKFESFLYPPLAHFLKIHHGRPRTLGQGSDGTEMLVRLFWTTFFGWASARNYVVRQGFSTQGQPLTPLLFVGLLTGFVGTACS
jgi:hypothetical protein